MLFTMRDGTLTEGAVIMHYLADQRPESDLMASAGTLERYRILEWMSFIASDLHKSAFMPLFRETTPAEYREIARQHIKRRLRWLNDHLATRKFLTGSTFTVADVHCYTIVMWTKLYTIDISPWPHLVEYLRRIQSRPSVEAAEEAERIEAEAQCKAGEPAKR
jgi:glutathione S-transferase